jgi:MazG family protein
MTTGERFEALIAIMDRLRDPGGCPWDREQTMESLKPYLIEEAYECLAAIESGDRAEQCDELGDLLLQIVFQARLGREEGAFTVDDVIEAISAKMIRRHPHVFAGAEAADADAVVDQWERIKRREGSSDGAAPRSVVAGIPQAAPALLRAARLGEKTGRAGLDWTAVGGVRAKLSEELGELDEAIAAGVDAAIEEELGDLLFTAAQLGRHLGIEPEGALRRATAKFTARVQRIEAALAAEGRSWEDGGDLEVRWAQAKAQD